MNMATFDVEELTCFIVRAKKATFAGDGGNAPPSRPGAHDLVFEDGCWQYRDTFFGTQDFSGQEIVCYDGSPVWGMSYYGRVLHQDVPKRELWSFLKKSLLRVYEEGRFLGPSDYVYGRWVYRDQNEGDTIYFSGQEEIQWDSKLVYRLDYFGGMIR